MSLNETKDKFLGMAAHDLRNPLTCITAYTDLLNTCCTENKQIKFHVHNSRDRGYKTGGGSYIQSFVEKNNREIKEFDVEAITFDFFVEIPL